MAFEPERLLSLPPRVLRHAFTRRDTCLYALGVGACQDPAWSEELQYVFEERLQALPTMAVVLAYPGFWQREPQYGMDWKRILHAEQSIEIHEPLPVEGVVRGELRIDAIIDKGAEKGALLYTTRQVFDDASNRHLASVRQVSFLRGDGGHGGSPGDAPKPHSVPVREADASCSMVTRPEQALIYRLSGDYNPLHADPEVAREAGLQRPILHGLCSFGIAGRGLLRTLCGNEPARLRRMDCRFTAPVYPGDTLELRVWNESASTAAFQVRSVERDVVVLSNGYAEYRVD